ncbi:16S rRNA (guanine(527)-N(7))-methyltransferase RsmG [Sandaracinobacter neustonicus]|uniref:Ribosomal RNA small subunit methyltransferase G n=1 Tax=Sandaracinobacter neustonicus TaxID=1715348 RepID=A0A501XSX2_9SPHN|nr:16S rRNA (guanine(527)-N(7))-methyltransferase RsmG [Sandaracinobacter neustonicus]TPE63304.1 16S rRNA (guanine(527)-N(7))-methyltransferase RsmG [Sandaracinobacter neustonicus]
MDRQTFEAEFNVPRGTIQRLERYESLLIEWQERMNLVGPATLGDVWGRHFADSAQITRLVPKGQSWLDIGAGGGFPGMVLAALDWGKMVLVDSIAKKCRFLEAVRDELALRDSATVINGRVEQLPTLGVDVATARAAAPLATLFDWAIRHVRPGGQFVFLKGRRWAEEVDEAEGRFIFDLETHESLTDPEARILVARNLKRL